MTTDKVRVGVVGMGHVGPAIASALRAADYEVVGVNARSDGAQERADAMLPGVPQLDAEQVAHGSDLLILAVPDDQIEPVAQQLVAAGAIRPGQVVAHVWGGGGITPLKAVSDAGAIPVAFHPAMTFSGTSLDIHRLQGCPVAYTTHPLAAPLAQSIISDLGGWPFEVAEEDRPLYHSALVHASNHLNTLLTQAGSVLDHIGVEDTPDVLRPLVSASTERALSEGTAGLTGPVSRGNWRTVTQHVQALAAEAELQGVAQTYSHLAAATRAGLGPQRQPTRLVTTRQQLKEALAECGAAPHGPNRRALVMTMGALHDGHLSLVEQVREPGTTVIATVFVNPQQFGEGEDLDDYPRTLDTDFEALQEAGVDIVYAPNDTEVYPVPPSVTVAPGSAADVLEGAQRPGHFAGVALVVNKMFNLIRPDIAVFGQKDAQQFAVIRQMVEEFDHQVELVEAPIVRDEDGLALSSRNSYLSDQQRSDALALNRALRRGLEVAEASGSPKQIVEAAAEVLRGSAGVESEYVALASEDGFRVVAAWPEPHVSIDESGGAGGSWFGRAYLLVAARVGPARLIDNVIVEVKDNGNAD